MKERFIIVVIAVVLGLAATTLGYFIYQSTKVVPETPKASVKSAETSPTPIENSSLQLSVSSPNANSVVTNRTVQVKGKTNPENTLLVSSNEEDVVARPANDGSFAVSLTIDAGTNRVITRVIAPNGDERTDSRVVSFSTQDF